MTKKITILIRKVTFICANKVQRSQWFQQHCIPVGDLYCPTLLQEGDYQAYQAHEGEIVICKFILFDHTITDVKATHMSINLEIRGSLG